MITKLKLDFTSYYSLAYLTGLFYYIKLQWEAAKTMTVYVNACVIQEVLALSCSFLQLKAKCILLSEVGGEGKAAEFQMYVV